MQSDHSIRFFDAQFHEQIAHHQYALNPFEVSALPHLRGRVLDFGCGMGNLAVAAAKQGCEVLALDASDEAIAHLRERAEDGKLAIDARVADLRVLPLDGQFDAVVSIGLLMFFDCPTALRRLANLQSCVTEGGIAVVNVLIEGTTYLDMFDPAGHCLFARDELPRRFAGWRIISSEYREFPAPGNRRKCFHTLIAQKPLAN